MALLRTKYRILVDPSSNSYEEHDDQVAALSKRDAVFPGQPVLMVEVHQAVSQIVEDAGVRFEPTQVDVVVGEV